MFDFSKEYTRTVNRILDYRDAFLKEHGQLPKHVYLDEGEIHALVNQEDGALFDGTIFGLNIKHLQGISEK